MADSIEEMGPVDYIVVEYPSSRITGRPLSVLLDLVDRHIVRIIDLAFLRKEPDGSVTVLDVGDLQEREMLNELASFVGASSGLLSPEDLREAANALEPGSAAALLVYENTWAVPFATALRRSGARLVASGRIPVQELIAALDAAESQHERVGS